VRAEAGSWATGFANAIMRKVSEKDEAAWLDELAPDESADPIGAYALRTAHPRWIARSFAEALGDKGAGLKAALEADDARPEVHLVARPGEISADELAAITGGDPAPYSPYGVRLPAGAGDPADAEPVRERLAAVQDEGSQLCAIAATKVPVEGADERWLDLCAGPGGKAALLGALAALSGASVDAVEKAPPPMSPPPSPWPSTGSSPIPTTGPTSPKRPPPPCCAGRPRIPTTSSSPKSGKRHRNRSSCSLRAFRPARCRNSRMVTRGYSSFSTNRPSEPTTMRPTVPPRSFP